MQPKLRSLEQVKKYLEEQNKQLDDEAQLIEKDTHQLISRFKVKAVDYKVLDISDGKPTNRRKKTLNVDFPLVKVPNKNELTKHYKIAEQLSERYKTLVNTENEVRLNFQNSEGQSFKELMGSFKKLKSKIEEMLRKIFTALSNVAEGHAPKEYKHYVSEVAKELEEHLEFDDAKTVMYAAMENGQLVFASYLILTNAISDEGKIAPHLYIVIKWVVGGDVQVFVEHEFTAPSLLEGGSVVGNLQQAAKAIKYQLSLEGFSSQIGSLPISMQIKTPAGGLNKELFSVKDYLKKIEAKEHELVFTLIPKIDEKTFEHIQSQLFQEVKALIKNKRNAKIRMQHVGNTLVFTIVNLDHKDQIAPYDLEFLVQKYPNLVDENKLRRIVNVIND